MFQLLVYFTIFMVSLCTVMILARLWNEFNLDLRKEHSNAAAHFLKMGRKDLAMSRIEKAEKLSKWYIRFI